MNTDGLTEIQKSVVRDVDLFLENAKGFPLTQDEYHKAYVALAYEMFNVDLEERGLAFLKRVDPNYFNTKFRTDVKEDPDFAFIVKRILGKMEEFGMVNVILIGENNEDSNS